MKKIIWTIILIMICCGIYVFKDDISKFIIKKIPVAEKTTKLVNNEYAKDKSYIYVQLTENFIANDKNDLLNILYTILNSGMSEFTFMCSKEYKTCIEDVDFISKDQNLLSTINNYVHPYNSFSDIETSRFEALNRVTLKITHTYTKDDINKIEEKVKEIIASNITPSMNNKDKIKIVHDFIINNSKYDSLRSDNKTSTYHSDKAIGPLFEGFGICNGYSDLFEIFAIKFGLDTIKIASENHIWNLVNIDNEWKHIDITWDDPIVENGNDTIDYTYFLINNEELANVKDDQHTFNNEMYKEAK